MKEKSNGSNAFSLLDRNKCFGIVASAVNHVVGDSVVDLRSPEVKMLYCLRQIIAAGIHIYAYSQH